MNNNKQIGYYFSYKEQAYKQNAMDLARVNQNYYKLDDGM